MMKSVRSALVGIGGLAVLALLMTLAAPKAVHAIVSTLVTVSNTTANPVPTQQVIPGQPFFARMVLSGGAAQSAGPGASGRLAVTNVTISNLGSGTQEVFVFAPVVTTGGTCGDAVIGGSDPSMRLLVPQGQTLTVSYPTALIFSPVNGVSCLAAENFVSAPIEVYVTGFVQ
ncbi:MAG: hypothetical protein WCA00_04490 [Candidatus Acidiferrales bacterium]